MKDDKGEQTHEGHIFEHTNYQYPRPGDTLSHA